MYFNETYHNYSLPDPNSNDDVCKVTYNISQRYQSMVLCRKQLIFYYFNSDAVR